MTAYIPRELSGPVLEGLADMPVVVISGMRQAGKSTFLLSEKRLKNRDYYTFDDFSTLQAAKNDPESFVTRGNKLSIDEAHKCPEIFSVIKRQVDLNRTPGRYILSGSANFLLLKSVSESLAGRALYLTLHPFSYRELKHRTKRPPLLIDFIQGKQFPDDEFERLDMNAVSLGGMPPVCTGNLRNSDTWFQGYAQTYLERDIRLLSQVADLSQFHNLLQLVAFRGGKVLNLSELARDAKLSVPTVSKYLSVMETSCVMFQVRPYLNNPSSRIIKAPKLYISDTGLLCYLTASNTSTRVFNLMKGAVMENFVMQNLRCILSYYSPRSSLLYWNIQGRYEVDAVIETGDKVIAVEVKASGRWGDNDLTGLRQFLKTSTNCVGAILAYNGTRAYKIGERLWAVPVSALIL